MSKINWSVRLKNKAFVISLISALLLFAEAVAKSVGIDFDSAGLNSNLVNIVNAAFVVLTLVGITTDPTTKGVSDSTQALGYNEPQ